MGNYITRPQNIEFFNINCLKNNKEKNIFFFFFFMYFLSFFIYGAFRGFV